MRVIRWHPHQCVCNVLASWHTYIVTIFFQSPSLCLCLTTFWQFPYKNIHFIFIIDLNLMFLNFTSRTGFAWHFLRNQEYQYVNMSKTSTSTIIKCICWDDTKKKNTSSTLKPMRLYYWRHQFFNLHSIISNYIGFGWISALSFVHDVPADICTISRRKKNNLLTAIKCIIYYSAVQMQMQNR